jgi:hypothetical protein
MLDKRLLDLEYPVSGRAFVENGQWYTSMTRLDDRRRAGHWVFGTATQVYRVGETPLWVVFVDRTGAEYVLEHSAQFIPSER